MWATGYQDGLGGSIEDEMTVSGGSVVDVSDGRYGRVVTASADFGFNKANMACSVLGEDVLMTGDLDPSATLGIVGSRIAERQYQVRLKCRGVARFLGKIFRSCAFICSTEGGIGCINDSRKVFSNRAVYV